MKPEELEVLDNIIDAYKKERKKKDTLLTEVLLLKI